jgi:vacuolar protein sorting-associated protein 3
MITVRYASNYWPDRQIFVYTIPSLTLVPGIKPIRNVMAFAVDHQHILRTAQGADSSLPTLPVDFCIVKRSAIVLYSIQEQLMYHKVSYSIPFPFTLRIFLHTAQL